MSDDDHTSSTSFQHPYYDTVTIGHVQKIWRVELERLETDDVILPCFISEVNMQHVLAWIIHMMQSLNRRCRAITTRRVTWAKNATQKDDGLVYYYQIDDSSAALVRDGRMRVLTLEACMAGSIGDLMALIGEEAIMSSERAAVAFAGYIIPQIVRNLQQ